MGVGHRALARKGGVSMRGLLCAGVVAGSGMLVICGWAAGALAGRTELFRVPAGGFYVECTA